MKNRLPTYFISHGGGPWPWLKKEMPFYNLLEESLLKIPRELSEAPKVILVISGHWEEDDFRVMASSQPPMLYDYSGFPAHTYQVQYPAPGSPELALQIQELLQARGLRSSLDLKRGFDHGTFTPLAVMYPEAQIPVLQISLQKDYSPRAHYELGQALAPLRDSGVLILASGLSYHNLRMFDSRAREASKAFDDWLQSALRIQDSNSRLEALLQWQKAPAARLAHPQEDHLIPIFVALGAADQESVTTIYHEENFLGGITASSFRFGLPNQSQY